MQNEDGLARSPMLIPIIGWILVLLIYFVSTALDKNRRPLHDRIAGATVIRQDREAGRASPPCCSMGIQLVGVVALTVAITNVWVRKLARHLRSEHNYMTVVGHPPVPLRSGLYC